jgi:hypothetical protein
MLVLHRLTTPSNCRKTMLQSRQVNTYKFSASMSPTHVQSFLERVTHWHLEWLWKPVATAPIDTKSTFQSGSLEMKIYNGIVQGSSF